MSANNPDGRRVEVEGDSRLQSGDSRLRKEEWFKVAAA